MRAKYWLIYNYMGDRVAKPFATKNGMTNYIVKRGTNIKVIAKTKAIEEV